MNIVNRIYFSNSGKTDFNIKIPCEIADIDKIKRILFRWFPKGAKLKYNYYKHIYEYLYFIILYKKRLYFYQSWRNDFDRKLKIKLKRFYIINKNEKKYVYIFYYSNNIDFNVYKYSKGPIHIYSKIKNRCANSPYYFTYIIGKLRKIICFSCNNIKKIYYNNMFFCYDNISFCYRYINDYVFITKSEKKNENLIFNGQFRCFLLFI